MKRRPVVVEQTPAAGDVCCVSFPAGGSCREEYTFVFGPRSTDDTSKCWVYVIWGWGSAARAVGPGAGAGVPVAGASVTVAGVRIPEVGVEAVLLSSDCSHLAGEVLHPLQQRDLLCGWANASERWLGCGLDDAVCTAARGVQVALGLAGENGPYVGW
jgi:hypothetical protein